MASATPPSSLLKPTFPLAAATTFSELPAMATLVPTSSNISTSFSPSPSANTFAGSTSMRFRSFATAAPLLAPRGKNSSIPGTAVVMVQSPSNISSASSRVDAMSSSGTNIRSLLIGISASTTPATIGPTASGSGSP